MFRPILFLHITSLPYIPLYQLTVHDESKEFHSLMKDPNNYVGRICALVEAQANIHRNRSWLNQSETTQGAQLHIFSQNTALTSVISGNYNFTIIVQRGA